MRSFFSNFFKRLIILRCTWFFLEKITSIGCGGVKSIAIRIFYLLFSLFLVRIRIFFDKLGSVCGRRVKKLLIWYKLIVLYENTGFWNTFCLVLIEIFRGWVKRDISTLIFHPRNYFLTHLRLLPWKILSIFWVNIGIWHIRLCF